MPKGWSCPGDSHYGEKHFETYDRNDVFDDGILKYRAAREKNFSSDSREERIRRVEKTLIKTLTQHSLSSAPPEFFVDKIETFLTCRAVSEKLETKIGEYSAEEIALAWIYTTFVRSASITYVEIQQFMKALPEILARPFPICKEIKRFTQETVLPHFCEALKHNNRNNEEKDNWKERSEWNYIQKLLCLIK